MRQLAVFAKHWTPGLAKTRLAADVGPERAAAIYRACLETTLRRFDALGDRRDIVFTPRESEAEFQKLAAGKWRVVPQAAGNLGSRLEAYATRAHTSGSVGTVILGSDSPTYPCEWIESAWTALRERPVVVGPASDGGYCLLGVTHAKLPVFAGIAWGTADVLEQTTQRLHEARLNYSLLSPWYDVDDAAGLARLRDELRQLPADDPQWDILRAALRRLDNA